MRTGVLGFLLARVINWKNQQEGNSLTQRNQEPKETIPDSGGENHGTEMA